MVAVKSLGIAHTLRLKRKRTSKWKAKFHRKLSPVELSLLIDFEQKVEDAESYISMVGRGLLTGFIWCGNHGIGKTTRAKMVLDKCQAPAVEHRGRLTGFRMYVEGWHNRDIINIGDDCDELFSNKSNIELVKEATDHNEPRMVSWNTAYPPTAVVNHAKLDDDDTAYLSEDNNGDIPIMVQLKRYKFRGAWVLMTNLPVVQLAGIDRLAGNKKGIAGIIDRVPVVSCFLDDRETQMLWVERCVAKDAILYQYGLDWEDEGKILSFMRERIFLAKSPISLRTLNLVAYAYMDNPSRWERLAEHIMRK
jgi:hypothetical protein